MKYTVRILRRAESDLSDIHDYIAEDSPQNATRMIERILDRVESLNAFPFRGSRPRDERLRQKGYRFLVETPYLIFYKVGQGRVWVHRVLHGKRAYERIL